VDIWIAAKVTPALTAVRMPCAEAGAEATRLLLQRIEHDGAAPTVLLTELTVRSSTGAVPERNP
jgi:DNA-binding LacI/PurR family transcriptional regulator